MVNNEEIIDGSLGDQLLGADIKALAGKMKPRYWLS